MPRAWPPASTRRAISFRSRQRRTTTWAASRWTRADERRWRDCGRRAKSPRPARTAPIGWPPTRCWRRSYSRPASPRTSAGCRRAPERPRTWSRFARRWFRPPPVRRSWAGSWRRMGGCSGPQPELTMRCARSAGSNARARRRPCSTWRLPPASSRRRRGGGARAAAGIIARTIRQPMPRRASALSSPWIRPAPWRGKQRRDDMRHSRQPELTALRAESVAGSLLYPDAFLSPLEIDEAVTRALAEDLGRAGDVTSTATIPADARGRGVVVARQPGVIAGLPLVEAVFRKLAPDIGITAHERDGAAAAAADALLTIAGN